MFGKYETPLIDSGLTFNEKSQTINTPITNYELSNFNH